MAHALVFGASGISGWAIAKEALSYPTNDTFAQVTALANRPLSIEDAQLPKDSRLHLVSGIDLTSSVADVERSLQAEVKNLDTISHVFFTAYIDPGKGFDVLREINTQILKTAIQAVTSLSKNLKTVILQTGGKAYGVEFPDQIPIKPPLKESYPRIPEPFYNSIFYYFQHDLLKEMSKNASWTFTEVRPDVIIGFVPTTNFMNCAQGLGLYLSLYRQVHGKNASVPFPGTQGGWTCKHTDTSQDILARFEIHAALNQDKWGDGRVFNAADGNVTTWKEKWPGICAYFDLKGEGPGEYEALDQFAQKNANLWEQTVKTHGLKNGRLEKYQWGFLDFVMAKFDFDREYDLDAARSAGFSETTDTVKGYHTAFDRMRAARVIP